MVKLAMLSMIDRLINDAPFYFQRICTTLRIGSKLCFKILEKNHLEPLAKSLLV